MDDDLLGFVLVLSVLGVGVIGGIILLFMYAESVRRYIRCCRKEKDVEKAPVKRTTIVIARPPPPSEIVIEQEEGKHNIFKRFTKFEHNSRTVHPTHLKVSRTRSAPAKKLSAPPGVPSTPTSPPNSPLTKSIAESMDKKRALVYIGNETRGYQHAHSMVSQPGSPSTESSYLPGQLQSLKERRVSC